MRLGSLYTIWRMAASVSGWSGVTPPGASARATPLVPPGADGVEGFARRCVGCQLCVTQCPNQVLRPLKIVPSGRKNHGLSGSVSPQTGQALRSGS